MRMRRPEVYPLAFRRFDGGEYVLGLYRIFLMGPAVYLSTGF